VTETRAKYHARPTVEQGVRFDSEAEARRYRELRLLEYAGEITGLVMQPRYELTVNREKVGEYVADFRYTEKDQLVVEDVKGIRTGVSYRLFKLKARLMHALYGIEVREVTA